MYCDTWGRVGVRDRVYLPTLNLISSVGSPATERERESSSVIEPVNVEGKSYNEGSRERQKQKKNRHMYIHTRSKRGEDKHHTHVTPARVPAEICIHHLPTHRNISLEDDPLPDLHLVRRVPRLQQLPHRSLCREGPGGHSSRRRRGRHLRINLVWFWVDLICPTCCGETHGLVMRRA